MQIANDSLFVSFVFESLDERDQAIDVVICRGTFDIIENRIVPSSEQQPVVLADEYHNQPLTSSVRVDTDLVPKKYAADITLNSVAHAPDGNPTARWLVNIRVGRISKQLQVTGPRSWKYGLVNGWQLTRPEPATEVPLRYEYAFGGQYQHRDKVYTYDKNRVGLGFNSVAAADPSELIPAPQIEDPKNPVLNFGQEYEPAGFGPIPKHCMPRRQLCGTADEDWKRERWPRRPLDFDFRYYNCAPRGQIYPGFLRGDEDVWLTGLSPDGPIEFTLPGISQTVFALWNDNEINLESMNLDTLHIDTTKMQVYLTWRLSIPKTGGLKTVQIVTESLEDQPLVQG